MFWTVTWMQDGNGKLVQEMTAHGLTAVPNGGLAQIYNVPVEAYSKTVGAYAVHSHLFIAPANTEPEALTAAAAPSSAAPPAGHLGVPQIQSAAIARLFSNVPVQARFSAIGGELRNVSVHYYDGNTLKAVKLIGPSNTSSR